MKIWAGQGIKDNPYVMDVLRQHNEAYDAKKDHDMDPTSHVSKDKETGKFYIYDINNKKVKEFDTKPEADAYAKKNHDALMKKEQAEVKEKVDVDRRTKGFKDAMIRQEKAKKVREKYKKKKEAKKDQAELDARYDYDGEVDTVLAAANYVLAGGKNEDAAANAVAHGGVDMAPNAGKKKKKKNLMARRY